MSNSTVEFDQVDYTHGEECMKVLYNERNVVAKSWADFLALPKSTGYENNIKRVPNDFSENVVDKKGDKYTTIEDCLDVKKIE